MDRRGDRLRTESRGGGRVTPGTATNAVISLAGAIIPALVALVAIPGLVQSLGTELFGLLSFVWIVFGTFAVLDFGTGRATTKYVAELIAGERADAIPGLFWTASAINLAVGLVCGVVLFVGAPWIASHVVKVPEALTSTTVVALRITALALPWVVLGGVFRSALEGLQRFDLSTAVQLPVSALNYVAPLIVARSGASLSWVIAAVCVSRVSAVVPLLMLCRRQLPTLGRPRVERAQIGKLVRFGSWLTVSNVVGPLLLSMDRLLVGSVLGVGALGLYAPVYELVTRLSLIPGSVMAALFPAFSTLTNGGADAIRHAMRRAQRLLALLMLPVAVIGISFAPLILRIWLDAEQPAASVMAMRVLLIGLFVLALGAVPFTLVQALDKPKWSAMVHVVELPIHAVITWFAVSRFGIVGAAAAWSVRAAYDAALFDVAVRRMIGRGSSRPRAHALRATTALGAGAALLAAFSVWLGSGSPAMIVAGVGAVIVYGAVAWKWALEQSEREAVRSAVGRAAWGRSALRHDPIAKPAHDKAGTR